MNTSFELIVFVLGIYKLFLSFLRPVIISTSWIYYYIIISLNKFKVMRLEQGSEKATIQPKILNRTCITTLRNSLFLLSILLVVQHVEVAAAGEVGHTRLYPGGAGWPMDDTLELRTFTQTRKPSMEPHSSEPTGRSSPLNGSVNN